MESIPLANVGLSFGAGRVREFDVGSFKMGYRGWWRRHEERLKPEKLAAELSKSKLESKVHFKMQNGCLLS